MADHHSSPCAGCASVPEAAEAAAAVDGEDSKAWHLPLPPLNATSLPEPYSPGMPCPTMLCFSACWPALQRMLHLIKSRVAFQVGSLADHVLLVWP